MDRRLIFRHRARTIKSAWATGLGEPSVALEMPRLTVQAPSDRGSGGGKITGDRGRFGWCLASKKSPRREAARARTANRHW